MSNVEGYTLSGSFTLWIRRPADLIPNTPGARDCQSNDALVLVSEGIAPYTGDLMS